MLTLQALTILKETTEPAGPFGTMPQEPWHPGKDAKLALGLRYPTQLWGSVHPCKL